MKNGILFLLAFLVSISLLAQTDQDRIYEQKGEQLMKEAADKIRSYRSLKIDFTYEMKNEDRNIVEQMSGTLLSQGDKYRMEVGDNIFISDGVTVWSFLEELDEVHINLVENTDGGINPTAILEGFEADFRSKFIRQERHQGKLVDIIDLLPKGPQAFFKYRVALDASTKMIVYTSAYDRQGGIYTYNLNRFQPDISINDRQFTFNPQDYPGVDVIDLR